VSISAKKVLHIKNLKKYVQREGDVMRVVVAGGPKVKTDIGYTDCDI